MSSASKIIQAAAGNAAGEGLYVEEVFSTYLYDGNGSTQTITNDIDLDGEGGLVWVKGRDAVWNHFLLDTERGPSSTLFSHLTLGAYIDPTDGSEYSITSFNSDGFSLKNNDVNNSAREYVSWTFRKAPKFFDVVTYTGTGSATTVSHNLGSVPGCIMVKRTDTTGAWQVYHRANTANPETDYLVLNSTAATADSNTRWNDTAPTDSVFTVGTEATVNASGGTYVAYLFAHNDGDGEFGESGDQDIIKCGSYTGNGSTDGPEVDLGFEPQWILIRNVDTVQHWVMVDNMRGIVSGGNDPYLRPNTNDAEFTSNEILEVTPTGFKIKNDISYWNGSSNNHIYIAIRRGPMKTPESGTEVFDVQADLTGSRNIGDTVSTSLDYADWHFARKTDVSYSNYNEARLTGWKYLRTETTNAEAGPAVKQGGNQNELEYVSNWSSGFADPIDYFFKRAPGFFDVVAYEGTGSTRTVAHNLGVAPELIIVKKRTGTQATGWMVYTEATGATKRLELNTTGSTTTDIGDWNDTAPTSSVFTVRFNQGVNNSSSTYIAYLFATLPGVSKVGSYTGNGTSQTIDCGFSAGARFVMTKRTNTTGNWNVWDSERGIVAGNDPRLELNTTDAEDTGHDYIDPDSSGFVVNYVADDDDDTNVSGDTYIFLAIA